MNDIKKKNTICGISMEESQLGECVEWDLSVLWAVWGGRCGVGGEEVSARVPWLASAEGGARLQCGRRAGSSRLAVPVDCCLHFSLTGGHQPQGGTPTTWRIVFPKIWIASTSCNQRWKYWLILSFISTGSNPCLLPGWLNNYQHNTPPLSIIQQYVAPAGGAFDLENIL